jgi:hypothetical protein
MRQSLGVFVSLCLAGLAGRVEAQTVTGPAFQVVVSLSPAAAAKLASPKETIIVTALYYGAPTDATANLAVDGQIYLTGSQITTSGEDVEIPAAGVAMFKGPTYDKSKLKLIKDGQPLVDIGGVSGRHTSPDNLLDCGFVDGASLQEVASHPTQLSCKLIGEP